MSRVKRYKKMSKLVYLLIGILSVMLICVGVLIMKKKENNSLYSENVKGYDIESSYGNLLFPEKWDEYVKTETIKEAGVETIQFWVELKDKEKIHVFDIIFGGDGYKVGTIELNENEKVDVYIESYTYDVDDSWSDEDKEILNSIDHDINYLLEKLNDLENFTPA